MPQYRVTLYEPAFYKIVVDAADAHEAAKIARDYVRRFPGTAQKNTRDLAHGHIEPVQPVDG